MFYIESTLLWILNSETYYVYIITYYFSIAKFHNSYSLRITSFGHYHQAAYIMYLTFDPLPSTLKNVQNINKRETKYNKYNL